MRFWGFELVLLLVQIQVEFVGEADAACEVAVEVRGIRDSSFMVDVQSLGVCFLMQPPVHVLQVFAMEVSKYYGQGEGTLCLLFVFGIAVGAGE